MRGRLTNLGLLILITLAFVTGWIAFAIGTTWVRIPVILHGIGGLAIVVLVPWKSVIVKRGLARSRIGSAASVALLVVVGITLISGVLFSAGLVLSYGPISAMQLHVGSAFVAVPLVAAHVWIRPVRPHRVDLSRRSLLQAGGVLAASGVAYGTLQATNHLLRLPGRDRRATGSHERGSFRPAAMPVTSWINDATPRISAGSWALALKLNDEERRLPLAELTSFDDEVTATLDCTSGWYSTQIWQGVYLDRLLGNAEGRSFVVRSTTGFRRRFPLGDASDVLLATAVGDEPLSRGHGFPARVVAPGRRGFWWVKWVESIEVDDRPWWWQSPFPLT